MSGRVTLGALLCVVALASPNLCDAKDIEAAPTRSQIEKHLDTMYRPGTNQYVVKWNRPIRYRINDHTRTVDIAVFQRVAAEINQRFGVDIQEDLTPDAQLANALFIFTDDMRALASHPAIKRVFQQPGTTDAEYERSTADLPMRASYRMLLVDKGTREIVQVAEMFNLKRMPVERLEDLVVTTLFVNLAPAQTSDEIRPSLANTNLGRLRELYPIDRAYLSALYSRTIQVGIPYQVARPVLIKSMADYLGSK